MFNCLGPVVSNRHLPVSVLLPYVQHLRDDRASREISVTTTGIYVWLWLRVYSYTRNQHGYMAMVTQAPIHGTEAPPSVLSTQRSTFTQKPDSVWGNVWSRHLKDREGALVMWCPCISRTNQTTQRKRQAPWHDDILVQTWEVHGHPRGAPQLYFTSVLSQSAA